MILVTVGSQKFEFNRLLEKIDELIEKNVITEPVYAQVGCCTYKPKHYEYMTYIPKFRMNEKIDAADVIITHAGTGSIMDALDKHKTVIAVPRMAKYKEHVDDHQREIVSELMKQGVIKQISEWIEEY